MSDELQSQQSDTNGEEQSFRSICEMVEDLFGALVESMPDAILIANPSGNIVLANSHAEKLFGYERGDLISQKVEVLMPAHYRAYHVHLRSAYMTIPDVRPMGQETLSGLRQDGSEFPTEISLSPIQTERGLLVCVCVRDVTRRAQITDALRRSEEQVRLLLDSTFEAIYGLDLQGNCTFCNRACVETLGYRNADQLLGQNMHDLIHHTHSDGSPYPMTECRIYEAIRQGKGTHVHDEVLWKADGSSFPSDFRSFPIKREGELVGSVVTFLDISEQRRVEEALRTQQSELNHAARLSTLGEMAAGLAHELNQPLTAMSAFAEGALVRLERGTLGESEVAPLFSRIAEDAQRAGDIIRHLRNFVQKREAQRHRVDINHLVRDVYKFLKSDAKQEAISVQFELGDALPEVEADPIELQQVLLNLIRNAYDALAPTDSPSKTIVVSSSVRTPGRVEINVEDSGPGISESKAMQVFEPFYSSKDDGLGIGLGICKTIIEAHGGKIWLENSSLGGASVHFDLPSCQQEEDSDAP